MRQTEIRHIQGDLQIVFDALYELGVIDPVLQMDWTQHLEKVERNEFAVRRAVDIVNRCGNDKQRLFETLAKLDEQTLELLAVEVAREFAGFHARAVVH